MPVRLSKPSATPPATSRVRADPLAELIEVDVARLRDRAGEVEAAVPFFLPALARAIAEVVEAVARLRHVRVERRSGCPRAPMTDVASLNVEPGGYWPWIALLYSGWRGSLRSES